MSFARAILIMFAFAACALAQESDLPKTGKIEGTVLDSQTGLPISRAVLSIEDQNRDDGNPLTSVASGADGHFAITDVPPGSYELSGKKAGFVEKSYGATNGGEGIPLTVKAGDTVADIVLRLDRSAVIAGRVVDDEGEPFPGAQVVAMKYIRSGQRKKLLPVLFGQTDDRGEYRIFGLDPGAYYVRCTFPGGLGGTLDPQTHHRVRYIPIYYPSAATIEGAVPLKLKPGTEALANFSLSTGQTFAVRGKIAGAKPGERFILMVTRDESGSDFFGDQRTQPIEGSAFELKDMLPGSYRLRVSTIQSNKSPGAAASEKVTVADEDVDNVLINIADSTVQVHGVVKVPPGSKLDFTKLQVHFGGEPPEGSDESDTAYDFRWQTTPLLNQDGSFTATLIPRPYNVSPAIIGPLPDNWYIQSVTADGNDVSNSGIKVTPELTLAIALSPDAATISGTVVDSQGKPVAGASIGTVSDQPRFGRTGLRVRSTSDQNGKFSFGGIAPGSYKVLSWRDDESDVMSEKEILEAFLPSAIELKAEAECTYNVTLTLSSGDETRRAVQQ